MKKLALLFSLLTVPLNAMEKQGPQDPKSTEEWPVDLDLMSIEAKKNLSLKDLCLTTIARFLVEGNTELNLSLLPQSLQEALYKELLSLYRFLLLKHYKPYTHSKILKRYLGKILSLAISQDGNLLLVGIYNGAELVDISNVEKPVFNTFIASDWVASVAMSRDNNYALTSSQGAIIRLWDIADKNNIRLIKELKCYQDTMPSKFHSSDEFPPVAYSLDGKYGLIGLWEGGIYLWDLSSFTHKSIGHLACTSSVAFDSRNRYALAGSISSATFLYDIAYGGSPARLPVTIKSSGRFCKLWVVLFSPHNNYILVQDNLFDLSNKRKSYLSCSTPIISAAFSSDSRFLATGHQEIGTVQLWDLQSRDTLFSLELAQEDKDVNGIAFHPQGKYIITGSSYYEDNVLRLVPLSIENMGTLPELVNTLRKLFREQQSKP